MCVIVNHGRTFMSSVARFEPFPLTPEIAESFRAKKQIPAHLYSKEGQILIYKKEDAGEVEIERLLKFAERGIYYNTEDAETFGLKGSERKIPEGLSDTKLLGEETAVQLSKETSELFAQLRGGALTAESAKKTRDRLDNMFKSFEEQPDAMIGLVNILEFMKDDVAAYDVQMAVKRTVVSMAMKTRGMHANSFREKQKMEEMTNIVMMSALFCDIGITRMTMPTTPRLTDQEMTYIKNHPLMSYLMLAHQDEIDPAVKRNILCHHRPLRTGITGNNYPDLRVLIDKLSKLEAQYSTDSTKTSIVKDIRKQLVFLKSDVTYDEDANILAIASAFASLTSKVAWRDAMPPEKAVRAIINESYFTFSERAVREFLDHVAISLCDNKKILAEGDFIIIVTRSAEGKNHFEICQITQASRYQSRPGVDRVAEITPRIEQSPKLHIAGFDLDSIKPDRRFAHYELAQDDSRRLVYAIDPEIETELYARLQELVAGRKRYEPEKHVRDPKAQDKAADKPAKA